MCNARASCKCRCSSLEKPRPVLSLVYFLCLGFIKSADRSAFKKKKTKKKKTEKKKLKLKKKKKKSSRFSACVCVLLSFSLSLSFLYYYKKGNREVASRQRTAPAFEAFAAARNACSLSLTLSSYQSLFSLSLSFKIFDVII